MITWVDVTVSLLTLTVVLGFMGFGIYRMIKG